MTAAKVINIVSRLPWCSGQAADAVSYTQVKVEDRSTLFHNSKVRMSGYLDASTKTQTAQIMIQYGRSKGICTVLCIFGSHTFVPMSWMCKKQTSVSHSSTESQNFSLDVGLRMDDLPALTLGFGDLNISFSPNRIDGPKREPRRNPSAINKPNMHNPNEAHQRHSNKHW